MEPTPKQQAVDLLKRAKRVLVMAHAHPDGDSIGSTLALTLALRKLGKEVTPVCSDPVPGVFSFLSSINELTSEIQGGSGEFVVTLNTEQVTVDKLGYKNLPDEKKLNIVIKTSAGEISPEMFTFSSGSASADLIVVLDTNDVERLGSVYEKYAELFYKTPIVNIDHHPGNDYFGKVNWVDLTATSTAEILVSLLESLGGGGGKTNTLFDPEIATLLLTGITTDTGSFQNTNTTPKSFTVAAQLVAAGARQQEIVQHIYKTKPLSTLKLWGKILSHIHEETPHRFIYSTASASDFKHFGAAETETSGVVDELLKTVPDIDFALLLSEKEGNLYGSLRGVSREVSVADVAGLMGGGGHEMAAAFRLPGGSLADNEHEIIEKIRTFQAKRLGQPVTAQPTPEPAPAQPARGRFDVPADQGVYAPDTPIQAKRPEPRPSIPSARSLGIGSAPADPVPAKPKSLKDAQQGLTF
ncbi:MAG: DHH family phosphoesterase [Patescibacteria group bacterium]|jgi:phosphoesterase RecJ-like protein